MINEIFGEIKSAFGDFRHGQTTRTITVAKPYCTPARSIITATFQKYGVKMYGYNEYVKTVGPKQMLRSLSKKMSLLEFATNLADPLPTAQIAEVTVSESAAAWAEYLLLRTGKLYVPGKYVNKKNEQWAKRHGGQMPPAWDDNKPWIEKSCTEGMKAWQPVRDAMRKAKKK